MLNCRPVGFASKRHQLGRRRLDSKVFGDNVPSIRGHTQIARGFAVQLGQGYSSGPLIGLLLIIWMAVLGHVECNAGMLYSFSNTNRIEILDSPNPPTRSKPYPSTTIVSNLLGCKIAAVTVTIHGFSHGFPSDVTVLLVGPQGQQAVLMAQVGGQERFSVTNLTLTFDDDAPQQLPVHTNLQSGVFRPTNGYLAFGRRGLPFDLPAPAPVGSSNAPAALAVFKDTDPNGVWGLFVVDDSSSDSGEIALGWTLKLTVSGPLHICISSPQVVISWPVHLRDAVLQVSTDLVSPSAWADWPGTPVEAMGWLWVTDSVASGQMFYRLKWLAE